MELTELSATRLAAVMRAREASPVEVVEAYLRRIERLNPRLNAVVTLAPDAIERAREAETAIMRGDEALALCGVPITVKDTIETAGLRTTGGSLLQPEHIPAEDALAVSRLRAAGAIILGKTNVPEMAIPYECDNPVFGRTNNPHDLSRTSGGSSGGEAAGISACLSPAGLGSDLSGSIRVPAHFCGIVGLKPSQGRTPVAGHYPRASGPLSLGAAIGPMARHVEDLSLLLKALTGLRTYESVNTSSEMWPGVEIRDLQGLRVGTCAFEDDDALTDETRRAIDSALRALGEAGLQVVQESPKGLESAARLWPSLFGYASTIQLREAYAGREDDAGAAVRAVLAAAEKAQRHTFDEFAKGWAERDELRSHVINWMKTTPLLVAPVGAAPAFEHGTRRLRVGERELSVFQAFKYSRAFNVLGLPCVAVPAGHSLEGLPIGVQIIGRPFEEELVLAAAAIIEAALGGWVRPPLYSSRANPL
jgi:Asp-tRNA(Asn)/Glu-tRNA(Gln) amidotransferase A subunit family amidase